MASGYTPSHSSQVISADTEEDEQAPLPPMAPWDAHYYPSWDANYYGTYPCPPAFPEYNYPYRPFSGRRWTADAHVGHEVRVSVLMWLKGCHRYEYLCVRRQYQLEKLCPGH